LCAIVKTQCSEEWQTDRERKKPTGKLKLTTFFPVALFMAVIPYRLTDKKINFAFPYRLFVSLLVLRHTRKFQFPVRLCAILLACCVDVDAAI
jgi:hypothetical protein